VLEPAPRLKSGRPLFVGFLEGKAGKDRSQWSNFWMDEYTSAPVVAFTDSEVCLHLPLVAPLFMDTNGTEPRLRNTIHLNGDAWGGVDAWALGHDTPVDAMYTGHFPVFFWRSDLPRLRAFLAARFGRSAETAGSAAAAFNEAFAEITNAPRTLSPYQWGAAKRWGYSQFNLMMNWAFHEPSAAARYTFHTPTDIPDRLPGCSDAAGTTTTTMQPWVAAGHNHVSDQKDCMLACCAMFGSTLNDKSCARFDSSNSLEYEMLMLVGEQASCCPSDFRCGQKIHMCRKGHPAVSTACNASPIISKWPLAPNPFPCTTSGFPGGIPKTWKDQQATQVAATVLQRLATFVRSDAVTAPAREAMQGACQRMQGELQSRQQRDELQLHARQQRERLAKAKGAGQDGPHVRPTLAHRQVGENDTRWRTPHSQHTEEDAQVRPISPVRPAVQARPASQARPPVVAHRHAAVGGADGFSPSRKFSHGHPEFQ